MSRMKAEDEEKKDNGHAEWNITSLATMRGARQFEDKPRFFWIAGANRA